MTKYKRRDGDIVNGERATDKIGIPRWILSMVILTAFTITGASITKLSASVDVNKSLSEKHEALIPLIQNDIKDIKDTMQKMSDKQDRQYESIMRAVKTN